MSSPPCFILLTMPKSLSTLLLALLAIGLAASAQNKKTPSATASKAILREAGVTCASPSSFPNSSTPLPPDRLACNMRNASPKTRDRNAPRSASRPGTTSGPLPEATPGTSRASFSCDSHLYTGNSQKDFNYEANLECRQFLKSIEIPNQALLIPDVSHSTKQAKKLLTFHADGRK